MTQASLDFNDVFKIATSGMRAQGERLRVVAENLANAESTATTPGGEPYRRREVLFKNVLDRASGVSMVKVAGVVPDNSAFVREFNPSHPSADAQGYVLKPNVKPIIENMDMREAQRGYEANLGVISTVRSMISRALEILRG
jgi:flagellar basal-body rod protein FlgC